MIKSAKNLYKRKRHLKSVSKMSLFQEIWQVVAMIPVGKVSTYGQIAKAVGMRDSRRVGQALHANKDPVNIPCHRVVFADGALAPGYAFGGSGEQRKKLMTEGVVFAGNKVDLEKSGWNRV